MPGFLTCGPDFFPGWVSLLFSAGLALGIAHHLPKEYVDPDEG